MVEGNVGDGVGERDAVLEIKIALMTENYVMVKVAHT